MMWMERLLTVKKDTRPRDPKGLVVYRAPAKRRWTTRRRRRRRPPGRRSISARRPRTPGAVLPTITTAADFGTVELVDDAALRGFADLIARDARACRQQRQPHQRLDLVARSRRGAAPGFGGARRKLGRRSSTPWAASSSRRRRRRGFLRSRRAERAGRRAGAAAGIAPTPVDSRSLQERDAGRDQAPGPRGDPLR